MNVAQAHLTNSQHSTKASSVKSNPKGLKAQIPGKENVNFLNFSKIAIDSTRSQDKRCNTDFPSSSFNISKFTTEKIEPYKFQTEANNNYQIISTRNFPNNGHFRSNSIANMPYKMPVHEANFKRPGPLNDRTNLELEVIADSEKNKDSSSFQKILQPQNLSISIQRKPGDLIEIPEISTPEKEEIAPENEENYRIYSLMKCFKHFEIVPKQQLIKKESFLSSFSNNDKSMMSFPDEITNSGHKNLLEIRRIQTTPKLLTNIIHKYRVSNKTNYAFKNSEKKVEKLLGCVEILEDFETMSNNFHSNELVSQNLKTKKGLEEIEETDLSVSIYRFLLERETSYQVHPEFLKHHEEINGTMRAVLIDWMSEVSTEFCLKRHTFQQAIYYLDKFMEINKNIKKKTLQLVGVSSLLISSKLEEIQSPNVMEFRKACDDGYTLKEIQNMELSIMKDLKWQLHPPTLQTWTDIFLTQWDLYVENGDSTEILSISTQEKVFFRKSDEQSYIHYRDFTQIIDVALLHYEILQYKQRVLVAALLFLFVGDYYKVFTKKQIYQEFISTSKVLFNFPRYTYYFSDFSENYLGFTLYEMLPTIQFLSQFFEIDFMYELPRADHLFEGNNLFEGYYEEFLTCHVHHQKALEFIKKKLLK